MATTWIHIGAGVFRLDPGSGLKTRVALARR